MIASLRPREAKKDGAPSAVAALAAALPSTGRHGWAGLLDACAAAGDAACAVAAVRDLEALADQPPELVARGLASSRAAGALASLAGQPDQGLLSLGLAACVAAGKLDDALALVATLDDKGLKPNQAG
jgi:hypothetical protein